VNIVIFGANGPTGRLLTRGALDAGHTVTAVTRHAASLPIAGDALRIVEADVHDPDAVVAAIAGQDVVLSTLGVPYSRKPITVYSDGARNIIAAMEKHGVTRLAVVSSSATDPASRKRDTGGGFFFERAIKPMVTAMGGTLYADMLRMEQLVRASDLDWTIVRPSGLFVRNGVTDYRVAEDFIAARYTSRADLADFLLRQATEHDYVRKAAAVATLVDQPTVLQLIRSEAFQSATK
jgi:putative NADH-flavin reductase